MYAGVDVWARACIKHEEGAGCKEAVQRATRGGVSVAMFAPGWVQERGFSEHVPGSAAARNVDAAFWEQV